MSAKFIDVPADQWTQEFYADELAEQRKFDRRPRQDVSNHAAAFNALMHAGGIHADVHQALHIFLGMTRGSAPGEDVLLKESEAGALLPGEASAQEVSLRKRWTRAWSQIEAEMRRTGRRLGERVKGEFIPASRERDEKKVCPRYRSEIAQAVVDITRRAAQLRGRRGERFERAALEAWASLPPYVAPEESQTIGAEHGDRSKRRKPCRAKQRWNSSTLEMIEDAKARGAEAVDALRASLHADLETFFADVDNDPDTTPSSLDNTLVDRGELVRTIENTERENTEENCKVDSFVVDTPVHDDGAPDDPSWLAVAVAESAARRSGSPPALRLVESEPGPSAASDNAMERLE